MDSFSALTELVHLSRRVTTKRSGLSIAVWGDAGIGKSHLTQELLRCVSCQSFGVHATTPLAKLAQTFGYPKRLPLWARHQLERVGNGETIETKVLIDAFVALFAALAPVIVHLEDSHEANLERLEFIRELGRGVLHSKGVGLLLTSRQEPPDPFTALCLRPLPREESDRLLEGELKNALPTEALGWIYQKARGNPLYSLEYLRYLNRQGFLWSDGTRWHWRTPPKDAMPITIEALIEQLLDQAKMEPLQKNVLETQAFLPLETSEGMSRAVAGINEPEWQTAVTELSQQGMFKSGNFAHPLFREVTFKTLTPKRKQTLARRAIDVFEHVPELSVGFVDDACLEPGKALELLERAAGLLEQHQRHEASRCLEHAAQYARGEKRGQLVLRAAQLASRTGDERALMLAQQATEILGETEETLRTLIEAHALRGERSEAHALLTRFSDALDTDWLIKQFFTVGAYEDIKQLTAALDLDTVSESTIYFIAYVLMDKGDLRRALDLADGRLQRPNVPLEARTELLDIRASVLHYQGKYQEADAFFSEIIALYKQSEKAWDGVANALRNRALNRLQLGLYREVLPDFLESLAIYEERGARIFYAQTLVMLSEVYHELAHYDQALAVLSESLTIFERVPVQPFYVHALANLATLYADYPSRFSAVLAPKYAQLAVTLAPEVKSGLYSAMAHLAASRVGQLTGDASLALSHANTALRAAEGFVELTVKAQMARAWALEKEQRHDALELYQSALQTATQHGLVVEVQKLGLELDRLEHDLERAKKRVLWFKARGLVNAVNIAQRYFPDLAEKNKAADQQNLISFEVLGPIHITHGHKTPLRGRKRQELVAQLLEARISGRNDVSRLTLLDTLYPDEDERKANASLKVLIHTLRETLGNNTIVTTPSGYALGECTSDAERFLQSHDLVLWRGPYLQDLDLGESVVRDLLYGALFERAIALLEINPQEVARVGSILVEAEPYNKDYLRTNLIALRRCKSYGRLMRQYQASRGRLLEVGEALPETWQAFLEA